MIALSQQMPVAGLSEVGARGAALGSWQAAVLLAMTLAAPGLGLGDHPDGGRKRHARPIPMTGGLDGLALIVIFFALAGLYWTGRRGAVRLLKRHLASRPVLGPAE